MTRTLPSRIRLPAGSSSSTNESHLSHLGGNATLPTPWSSSSAAASYQKHTQQATSQPQQQPYQHLIHHNNHPSTASSISSKGYRGMNGVISGSTPPKMPGIGSSGSHSELHPHHYPPPRPFSQTLPHNKYHFSPVQNAAPSYHHPSYHPPPAGYSQSKIASVHPTHLYNGGGVSRSYASPVRTSPPPTTSSSMATVKPVGMCIQQSNSLKNGNRTPSPSFQGLQGKASTIHHDTSAGYHGNNVATNDVPLRRGGVNGSCNGIPPNSSSSSRRHAVYLQQSSAAVTVKTTTPNQPYYQQPSQQQQQQQQQQQHQQQQQQAFNENWNYSKSSESNGRNIAPMGIHHRSLSPQDVVISYEETPSRNSPIPQNGKNGCLAKPPLPPALADGISPAPTTGGPRPPPRTRPKSWTSSLFNAMRNNHSSVTFQCVVEEQGAVGSGSAPLPGEKQSDHRPKDASELAMPLTAASASDGQKFYSLPRFQNGVSANDPSQSKMATAKTRSRTPSPFRTIIKGLVKGKTFG